MDTTAPADRMLAAGEAEDPLALLAAADALRDRGEWIDAAVGYAAYLRVRPDDWPIWVQYGHCMKESGDAKAALLLYREAERLRPEDADLHLQIGHALKLLGRIEEAYQEYATALTLDPGNPGARAELLAPPAGGGPPQPPPAPIFDPVPLVPSGSTTGALDAPAMAATWDRDLPAPAEPASRAEPPPPETSPIHAEAPPEPAALPRSEAEAAAVGRILFDVSDLLDYFRSNRAPTGIQRVQLQLIGAALAREGEDPPALVVFDPTAGAWKALPAETFHRLAELSRAGASAQDPEWAGAVAGAIGHLLRSPALPLGEGARLVNLGTSWWLPDYLRRVREAKQRCGLRYIPFLHDCIPLLVPEHCAAALVDDFARWFAGVALLADAVLCNSSSTETDFRRLRARLLPAGAAELPTAVIRLDAALPHAADEPVAAPLPLPLRSGRPFVLFVGTIEARKNHLMVFNAWLALMRRHGAEAVPDLVCVGKRGWLAEAALALHANSAALRERVHLLHDIPDPVLDALYRGALFTVSNSFYEGWGLPVTESLAHGKVPLVPDHSGFRESGAGLAVTFEPGNEPDLLAQLERLAFDPAFRAAREGRIAAELRLRSWSEVASGLLDAIASVPSRPAQAPELADPAVAPLGQVHPVALMPGPEPSLAMALADAVREGPAWSVLEPWGAWTLPGTARLRVPLPPGTEGPVRVHLDLQGPPRPQRLGLRAAGGARPAAFKMLELGAGERLFAAIETEAVEGAAVVEIDCAQGVQPGGEGLPAPDVRLVGVGVRSVMVCRREDIAARLDWLERAALPRLVRV